MSKTLVYLGIIAIAAVMLGGDPAMAQSIDLSPVTNLLQGIIDTITGPLGIAIATLAVVGVGISWLFGIIDFRQAMFVVVAIAIVAGAATITSYIVQMSLGDVPHGSLAYTTIFAAGLVLFLMTLVFNIIGFWLRRRFREAY